MGKEVDALLGPIPDATTVGTADSGYMGYFYPNLTVVNLDGIVNYEALTEACQLNQTMVTTLFGVIMNFF